MFTKKMKKAFAAAFLIAGLGASSIASANQAMNVSFTSTPLGDGSLVKWVMHVDTPGPMAIVGVELTFTPNAADSFNQIRTIPLPPPFPPRTYSNNVFQNDNSDIATWGPFNNPPITSDYDTQFMFTFTSETILSTGANESANHLFGAFAVAGAEPSFMSRNIAQLVLPAGVGGSYSGFFAVSGGAETAVNGTFGQVIDPAGPAIGIGTDPVDGALALDGSAGVQVVDLGGVAQGAVHLIGWNNVDNHNIYLDIDLGSTMTLDEVLAALNEALGGTGVAGAIPGGTHGGVDANVVINFPTRPFAGDDLYLEFDLRGAGDGSALLNAVVVPTPAAAFAGMALLGGLGLARRFRKD